MTTSEILRLKDWTKREGEKEREREQMQRAAAAGKRISMISMGPDEEESKSLELAPSVGILGGLISYLASASKGDNGQRSV